EVINVVPIGIAALRGQAVCVHSGAHGPGMNFSERKVLVDEADLVFVVVYCGRKEGLMHAAAVGALEIVEADDRDFGVRIAADGAAGDVDREDGIVGQVEGIEVGQGLAVGGDQEVFISLVG